MLEGFVEQYLLRYLGDYIFGVDKQNLSVTTWRGEIHLRSARLKQEVVELLNLPFQLIVGEAADLKINVPWNRLGSRPVVVELTGLRVLLGPKPATEWSNEEELRRVQLARQRLVDRADLLGPDDRKEGYLGRLITRISDNLELQLRDLHIRFQDDSPAAGGPPVSGGLHLASLEVQSTGSNWQPSFIERSDRSELFKLLRLRDLSCYHEPPGWARRIDPREWTDEDFRRCFDRPEAVQLAQGRIIYLLPPCSAHLKLTQALASSPRFDLKCELEPIKVLVSAAGYRGLCGIMSLVSEYFAFQEVTRHWIQSYWPHRPLVHVHGNSILWWRYALRCIRAAAANVRAQGAKVTFASLVSEENLSRLRLQAEYCNLVVKSRSSQLLEHEQARLQRLRVSLPATELLRCHAELVRTDVTDVRTELREEAGDERSWSFWGRTKILSVPSSPSVVALDNPAVEEDHIFTEQLLHHSGRERPHMQSEEFQGHFRHKPSVGSWLMRRPFRPPGHRLDSEGENEEDEMEMEMAPMEEEDKTEVKNWNSGNEAKMDGDTPRGSCTQDPPPVLAEDFRFKPSVGTWLQPRPSPPSRSQPVPEVERSWLAWLMPSRFAESKEALQKATKESQSGAESSSWLWRRKSRLEPEVPAQAAEKAQSSSWFPSFRWFTSEPPEEKAKEPTPLGEEVDDASPVELRAPQRALSPPQPAPSIPPSNSQSAWRVWFSSAEGTAPAKATRSPRTSPRAAEERQVRPVAFTQAVSQEAPLLRLALELPEVMVEMQTQEHVNTIGFARSLHVSLLAGEDLSTKAEVADLQLLVRSSRHKTSVDTRLLHVGWESDSAIKAMSVEYISRDSQGQPWISLKAEKLVLFYQQELFRQVTTFLALDVGTAGTGKPRRGFDRWRRRAKALLYTRGRPRCQLQLAEPTLMVPTQPCPRAPRVGGRLLALRARFVDAVSREVMDVKDEVPGFQLVRVDRWTVDCTGLQLLHFPSYKAFITGRPSDWTLLQDSNFKVSCLAKRYEELLPPALLAFGARQTPQALTSTQAEGETQSLALSFNSIAYDSFIRAFRLLLRGPAPPSPPAAAPWVSQAQPHPEEPAFFAPPQTHSLYSVSSEEEEAIQRQISTASGGSVLPNLKRMRFVSAASGLDPETPSTFRRGALEEPPTPLYTAFEEAKKEPEGHKSINFVAKIGVISMRFRCLPEEAVELKGHKAALYFDLFQGFARIGLNMGLLEMSAGRRFNLARAESESKHAKVALSLVAAWDLEAKVKEAEGADLRISVDLRGAIFHFSPMHFRSFISFAKSTPPGDMPPVVGNPLLWRIRVFLEQGQLQWVDEATGKLFAESRMKQSKILLDLHQETVSFSSSFENFSIQDCSSARQPMILAAQPNENYFMEISCRTFTPSSAEFKGYHTLVSISFRNIVLQYMGQKFVKCWQWVFGSFLPAVTAGRADSPGSEEEETSSNSSASFMSFEEENPCTTVREVSRTVKQSTELFMELAEGDFATASAWEAAEKDIRQAESSVPTLTRLHVVMENPVISIPLETGGQDQEPAVEIRSRWLKVSNGPCRRQNRKGLVDALAVCGEQVSIAEAGGSEMLAPQDMSVQIDLNLQVRPPQPMHVLWRAPVQLELSSRSLALLRAAFSKNVAGIDPDVAQTPLTPEQLSKPSDFPEWLIFRLLFWNFRLRMQEDDQTFAELAAKELQVKVKKHAAPRAVVSFELWEARLSTGLFPAPFNQLLCKRSSPKASARGRKGPSIHGDYISDHAEGQYFKIHCNRPRVQLQMPLLRRCWAWMFPPQPWFAPPAVTGERPSSELKVEATLQDAHVLLLEKFEEAPLISALTNMKYQLLSRQQLQEWSMNFENPEVFFSHGWTAVVDFELRAESKNRRLATAQHLAFDVATGTSPATGAGPSTERPDMQQPRCSRRLRCQELRGSLSNRDLQVWVACVKHAWGMEATDGKEENGQEESNENAVNSLEFNFNDAKVTLLSEHEPGSRWPFLELRASELCLGHLQRYKEKRLNGRAQLSLWLFNPLAAGWEPLLEGQPIDQSEPRQWAFKVTCKSSPADKASGHSAPRDSASIESAERLLLNVSDLCWRVLPGLSAPWIAPEKVMAMPVLSPYAVRNDLAGAVTLHLPGSQRLRLDASSEQCLQVQESDGRRKNLTRVTLQLEVGTRTTEVEGISLDRVGRRVYALRTGALTRSSRSSSEQALPHFQATQLAGRRKGLGRAASHPSLRQAEVGGSARVSPPYVVCRVQAKEAYKMLILEPPARIINDLSIPVLLAINGRQENEEVPPKGSRALALDLRGGFVVRPLGQGWSREFRFEWLCSQRQAGHFQCGSKSGPGEADDYFGFCIEWHTELIPHQDSQAPQYTIHLCAPVTLVSALPVACQCEVRSSDRRRFGVALAAGDRSQLHCLVPDELELSLAVFGDGLWSAPKLLRPEEKVSIAVPVDASGKHYTHFQLVITWAASGKPLTVVIHSPTWIADHVCSDHLHFAYWCKARQEPSSRLWERSANLCPSAPRPGRAEGVKPRTLPLDCRATHVAFRLDGHNDGFMTELVSLTALGSDQYYLKAVGAAPQAQSAHPDGLLLGVRFSERMEAGLEVRVLHVAPLQVAVNATRRILALRPGWRSDSESRMLELAPGGRAALHWRGGQELLVQARISDLTGSWSRWSGRLPVGSVGEYSFQSCWEKMSEVVFENFRVEVRNVEATTYFVFREAGKSAPILLRNFSVEPLLFQQELPHDRFGEDSEDGDKRQRWFRASSFTSSSHSTPEVAVNRRGLKLEPGQTRPFAWAEPLGSAKRLEVRSFLTPVMTRLTLEKTEKSLPLDISKHPLFYDVVTSGSSLVMTVRDRPRPEAFPALSEDRELQVNVNLAGLGLSLVAPTSCAFPEAQDNSDEVLRRELLNCSVEKIVGAFRRHDLIETLELSLQEVQVDNQREDASHPVLLKRRGEGKEDALPLLQLVLSRYCDAERPQLLHFDRLEVKLRSIDLRLDQGFIFDVMALATSIRSSLGVSTDSTADRNGDDLGLEKEGLKLHFNRLELGSAKVRVSFAGSSWGSAPGDVAFWKRLLSSLSSVDRAVLRFDEYTLQETTADAENFVTTLRGHYVKQFWRELKWFVGRLEVLGTPVTFCGSVARSCKEGALAPYKGATRSPEDMLEGCLLGTGGCVRNALFECFNSLSKATGAASQGCRICLPEDFQNPPTRGGLKTACDSCMGTMCHSVTGLCTRPVRGCRRGGLRGCASGATEGLFGCAGGIIVGCLDMTRQTTERLRNAASRTEQGRRRLPRALYGVERALRPFDQRDAELKAHFVASDPSLASMALLETVRDENGLVAAVSDLHFLYYSRDGHLTKVPLEDIMEVEVSDKAIVLQRAGLGELRLDDGAPERLRRAGRLLGECLAV